MKTYLTILAAGVAALVATLLSAAQAADGPRDPHAYSGGYSLESGKYALPGVPRLRLGDEGSFGSILFDRIEASRGRSGSATAYDAQAWFGRDYDRLVLKAEGEIDRGRVQGARTEALWGHALASYWDAQLGARVDGGAGADRTWLALGVQGLAPYWFEVDASVYFGDQGRTALRMSAEYEILLAQRLILQPRFELNLYGKRDEARGLGSGLSDGVAGLRLRYEVTRQFAPYVGVEWIGRFGGTADFARDEGERAKETQWVAGVRAWF